MTFCDLIGKEQNYSNISIPQYSEAQSGLLAIVLAII
jgi:hypothetical protein